MRAASVCRRGRALKALAVAAVFLLLTALIVFADPRYGAPPNAYGSQQLDGFQDVFTTAMATYIEWGLVDTANGVFDNYFTYYVRRHARVMYRGPELAQFGRMLTTAAQLYRKRHRSSQTTLSLSSFV